MAMADEPMVNISKTLLQKPLDVSGVEPPKLVALTITAAEFNELVALGALDD